MAQLPYPQAPPPETHPMNIFVRIIIAVICAGLAYVLVPLIFDAIGLDVRGSVIQIIKLCIAAIAVLYILRGTKWWPAG